MERVWLALQLLGVVAVVVGVNMLFHLPVALIVAGVISVVVAELKTPPTPEPKGKS